MEHTVLVTGSDESVRARLVPELHRSLRAGDRVVVSTGDRVTAIARAGLGPSAALVEWQAPGPYRQRLGFAYESFRRYLAAERASGRRVHLIAEPDFGAEPGADLADRVDCYLCYESMCNETYAGFGHSVTCVWDTRRYPAQAIRDARSVHLFELRESGRVPNSGYVPPERYLAARDTVPLEPPPVATDLDLDLHGSAGLGRLRVTLRSWAAARGFTTTAGEEVVAAIVEVAVNGLVHGAPPVRVRTWAQADTLVVQVDDSGGRPLPPTAGYRPPPVHTTGGRGVWLARQLADTVRVHTGDGHTRVRLRFPRELTGRSLAEIRPTGRVRDGSAVQRDGRVHD